LCLLFCQQARPLDKEPLFSKYRDKFVVVLKDGLSMCAQPATVATAIDIHDAPAGMTILINESGGAEPKRALQGCHVEPMHHGEVLKVVSVALSSGYFRIVLKGVSPHNVSVGLGAFAHESVESARVGILVWSEKGRDLDKADALLSQWLKPLDTETDATSLGNTSSGVFVKQVRAGMSFAEVEQALGLPQTRVDLGEKVLYKYRDMTVEFQSGKVVDVH
jgi:hypothetical protein